MVAAGSILTFDVQGQTGGIIPVDSTDLRSGVIDALTPKMNVNDVEITVGSTLSNVIDFQWLHYNYSAVVVVTTRVDYGQPGDVGSIIANAFYTAGGAVPSVTSRDAGQTQGPGITETGIIDGIDLSGIEGGIEGLGKSAGSALSDLFKPLTDLLQNTETLIVVGIIVVVGLIAFSPTGKAAAGRL